VSTRDYELLSRWHVAGTVSEVAGVFEDVDSLPRWWPSVYLSIDRIADGDADGVGRVTDQVTTGWLPYTLRWVATLTEPVTEEGFAFTARGDFDGTGRWIFEQEGPEVVVTIDWRITADKPLIRRLSWLLKPVFAANHRWSMARGEESLRLELRRRRPAETSVAQIALPPAATFRSRFSR